eukprot:CAMPEP_0197422468 /NCGR_PEP_ID=MMETSP1170-20131217/16021_1 /TAXON_ID=54406 /ORGANISM="Sarcinochrysis sp, Strain CCMP770" /LENGTH=78 /DNA_ID=CAMNT_0042949801 /DNA_START=224 /DNA_END=460 /DNA_ORIENTATION=-
MTSGKYLTAACALAFGTVMFLVPLAFTMRQSSLYNSAKGLSGSQVQRGQFMNTGSKDVGPDPDWDRTTRTYRPKSSRD